MADYIKKHPGEKRYRFLMEKRFLKGEDIVKEELDAICPDAELQIQEGEGHSIWVNSKILQRHGITDDTPDPIPGLAYYVRKDGHVTGNMFEGATEVHIILDGGMELTDEQIDTALQRWIDFSVEHGVSAVFDAGLPGDMQFHEKVYKRLVELDKQGKLPVYVDGSLVVNAERDAEEGLKELKRIQREYNTEHLKVHTMKVFMDGGVRGEASVYGVYFATRPDLRSTGIGGKAFKAILEYYNDMPFWFSYESPFEESDNAEQRERRRRFYLKNGFYETGWFTKLNGTEFIIASSKKEFDKEAFEKFMGAMFASTTGAALPELYRRD